MLMMYAYMYTYIFSGKHKAFQPIKSEEIAKGNAQLCPRQVLWFQNCPNEKSQIEKGKTKCGF